MSVTDLAMYRGDDRSFTLTVSGIDLTAADLTFTARRRLSDETPVFALETPTEIQITSSTTCVVNIPASATEDFTKDERLFWDLEINVGGEVRTLPDADRSRNALGTLVVWRDVTRLTA